MNGPTRDFCAEALASVGLEHEAAREQESEIKQLADMSPLDYCRVRKAVAKRLEIGVGNSTGWFAKRAKPAASMTTPSIGLSNRIRVQLMASGF